MGTSGVIVAPSQFGEATKGLDYLLIVFYFLVSSDESNFRRSASRLTVLDLQRAKSAVFSAFIRTRRNQGTGTTPPQSSSRPVFGFRQLGRNDRRDYIPFPGGVPAEFPFYSFLLQLPGEGVTRRACKTSSSLRRAACSSSSNNNLL